MSEMGRGDQQGDQQGDGAGEGAGAGIARQSADGTPPPAGETGAAEPPPERGARGFPDELAEELAAQAEQLLEKPQPAIEEMPGVRVTSEYFNAWNLQAAEGSLFTEEETEEDTPVMVVGSELSQTLFEDGISLGREVMLMRTLYEIVGILEPTGTAADETAFIPAQFIDIERIPQFARQFVGLNTTLHFTVFDPSRLDEARSQLDEWFSQEYGEGRVVITIPRVEVEAAQDRTARLVSIILFLAVAGLLIASVNVSNILLGRAMRKRKNIGILKALGASIRDVFNLFFIEALILGVSGAVLGAGISILISKLMLLAISGSAILSTMLFLGILAAWAITTSLTVIPALQASRIPAADALRYE
jgi:ABC-type antimicrobial peptide transport system permease subunit